MPKPSILKFVATLSSNSPKDIFATFLPHGQQVLNRTNWRGKEPRSCAITRAKTRPFHYGLDDPQTIKADVEVTYRPKGLIWYVGQTQYDGWTALIPKRNSEGKPVDEKGNPLEDGASPVYAPVEVYDDIEFGEINFGEFVGEFDLEGIRHISYEEMKNQFKAGKKRGGSIKSTFVAPRRSRPLVKILLSDVATGKAADGFGALLEFINPRTPNLSQVLFDRIVDIASGYIEGRYSIKNFYSDEFLFVELSDSFVDASSGESRFNCLHEFLSSEQLEDLAKRLISTYEIDVTVVDGPNCGLVIKRSPPDE